MTPNLIRLSVGIEDPEGIGEVEVWLKSKGGLLSLDVVLNTDHVTETVDHLVLVADHKDGLAAWGGVSRRLRGRSGGRCVPVGGGGTERRRVSSGRE